MREAPTSPATLAASRDDSVVRAMDILGERWTILILRQIFFDVHRFGEMQRNLGISRNILAAKR
jgi:DNA-binding HxlR family transcriptional regulator